MIRSILKAAHLKQYQPYVAHHFQSKSDSGPTRAQDGPTRAQDGPTHTTMQVLLASGDTWIPNAEESKSVIK